MTTLREVQKRMVGNDGALVAPIGLGCMSFSGVYGASDDANAEALVAHAVDELGVELLDSSDMYGWGHNESLLGRALAGGRRDRVFLITKFGQVRVEGGSNGVNGRPDYVAKACEASLERLGVDVIDLYFQHRIDPEVPIEETVGAMGRLVEQGKVRYLGLSEAKPETIRRAHATHPLHAVQTEFSLLYREEAQATREVTRALGIAFIAYSPLGRSLLTAGVLGQDRLPDDSPHKRHPRFFDDNLPRNVALLRPLQEMAAAKGCTVPQLALAWLLAAGDDVIPIPGTKSIARLEENLRAVSVSLTTTEAAALAQAIPAGAAAGTRYPAGALKAVQR